jgi:hypothetical protein
MTTQTIFISYNPDNEAEQKLAVRLQAIGAVNGFRTFLPNRLNSDTLLDTDTQQRIDLSNYYLVCVFNKLSKIVEQELKYALERFGDKARIFVVYDKIAAEKSIKKLKNEFNAVALDPLKEDAEQEVHIFKTILDTLKDKEIEHLKQQNAQLTVQHAKNLELQNKTLLALFLIVISLFTLSILAKKSK